LRRNTRVDGVPCWVAWPVASLGAEAARELWLRDPMRERRVQADGRRILAAITAEDRAR